MLSLSMDFIVCYFTSIDRHDKLTYIISLTLYLMLDWLIAMLVDIERNICILQRKHSFSHVSKRMCMLWKHTSVFFYVIIFFPLLFTLKKFYLIVNNEYKSLVFIILQGCLLYSNDRNILTYGTYASYYACRSRCWLLCL